MLEEQAQIANEQRVPSGTPVVPRSHADRASLIAETAFLLAKYRNEDQEIDLEAAEGRARGFLLRLPRSEALRAPMNEFEWHEANDICDNILAYTYWRKDISFSPVAPGCGVVDQAVVDAMSPDQLIEIKTITRGYRASDFRQVLTYQTMFYAKGITFDGVTLLNPRAGHKYESSTDELCRTVSGKAPVELFQEIMQWMMGLQVSA